jgi:hypothetical protein
MAIAISFCSWFLPNFFRLVLALSPSQLTKSKIQAIGLHEKLYEPNRQIIRSLCCSLSTYLHAYVGFRPHTASHPLPKSKGSAKIIQAKVSPFEAAC